MDLGMSLKYANTRGCAKKTITYHYNQCQKEFQALSMWLEDENEYYIRTTIINKFLVKLTNVNEKDGFK
jgi:hypothetical protein